jgi:hypothetical protein
MAISRMDMERQMRNMGGIMGLEDQRQGYFLGKLVKKAGRAVKKVAKSPLGKMAMLAAAGYGLGGAKFLGGKGIFAGGQGLKRFSNLKNLFMPSYKDFAGKERSGLLKSLVFDKDNNFSLGRAALSGLGAASIAAPFFMGGDEETEEEIPFGSPIPSVEGIRQQAREYYRDPTNAALYFMPPKASVQRSFYDFADGGLARPGYRIGGSAFGLPGLAIKAGQKAGEMFKAGVGKVKSLFDDADISIQIRDEDVYVPDYGYQAQATGQDVFIAPKSKKAVKIIEDLIDEGYDITKDADGEYIINALDEGALDIIAKRLRLGDKGVDEFMKSQDYYTGGDTGMMDEDSKMIYNALRDRKADGGLMDLGGYEKDYREGGFVPLGAKERADDVPARLSKNEFVFTADAVRNAGEGDIDRGAEVMQNMMDNLESGGTISEESQGKENPAQSMFDQAQQLESRIV